MHLQNLQIDRIIIHQVYRRDPDGNKVAPTQSHEFINFDRGALDAFKARVNGALGDGSNAVQMTIVQQGVRDLPYLINTMIDQNHDDFAVSSYDIALKLTDAQTRKDIPGGIVVVFTGKFGTPERKFFGIIKAEIYSAYEKIEHALTKEISLKYVEEVLLTPSTKMYKTAGFFQTATPIQSQNLNDKWTVMISDNQISKSEGKAAAQYFYSDFLGCGYPETSARTTRLFYESTSKFISTLDVSESEKSNLLNALTTYLKVDASSTASSTEFASRYFSSPDTQDAYTSFMNASGLPTTAFTKDNNHIEDKLRFRRINFRNNIKISAPSDVFKNLVVIETIEGDPDESGARSEWTKVIIKDRISHQE